MRILGKDGILYITLAIGIAILMPIIMTIAVEVCAVYKLFTGKDILK